MHPLGRQSERKTVMKGVCDIKGVCALLLPPCCGINVRWKEVRKKPQKKAADKQLPEGSGGLSVKAHGERWV